MKKLMIVILLLSTLYATPAYEMQKVYKQSDASIFLGMPKGDEWLNWVETSDGFVAKYNTNSKNYEYMTLSNEELIYSNIKVAQPTAAQTNSAILEKTLKLKSTSMAKLYKKAFQDRHSLK